MRRVARAALLVVVAGMIATVVALNASAGHSAVQDPNDTRGRLDVRVASAGGTEIPRWKVVTWGSWSATEIWDTGYVTINIDTFGTPRADYYVTVGSVGRYLFGELWRDRVNKRDFRVSGVNVWRAGDASVSAKVPLANMRIGESRLVYTWYVETAFTSARCPRVCFDLVPDKGVIAESLPFVTPTVSPSPTSSVSPSPTSSVSPSPTPSGSPSP